jgi:hypothetical protein
MPPTDGWLLWERRSVSSFVILIKTYFDEVLSAKIILFWGGGKDRIVD